jgi:hypothetical protein
MNKVLTGILITIFSLIILGLIIHGLMFKFNLGYRSWWNEFYFQRDVIDEEQEYENRRMVEDTARAMIANYNSFKLEYEAFKDFATDTVEYQRALQARVGANNIASNYNLYITQNNFVWKGNLPFDIPPTLLYLN